MFKTKTKPKSNTSDRCFATVDKNGDIADVWNFEKIFYVKLIDEHKIEIRCSGVTEVVQFGKEGTARAFIKAYYKYLQGA